MAFFCLFAFATSRVFEMKLGVPDKAISLFTVIPFMHKTEGGLVLQLGVSTTKSAYLIFVKKKFGIR
jgi:hypothetical protein